MIGKLEDIANLSQEANLHVVYHIVEYNGIKLLVTTKILKHAIAISHEFTKSLSEKSDIKKLADDFGVELNRRKDI